MFGFVADFFGAFIIWFLSTKINFISQFSFNDIKSLIAYILIISFTGFLIYLFNFHYTKHILKNDCHCKKFALRMGIITAPWLFLL